ncbi:MAG: ABC transporter ATP-binding protein [Planctomycetota bacterium]|jgi:oligopeptide/dipeptide ABC transporter ATP-binding protein
MNSGLAPILQIRDLRVQFQTEEGKFNAVNGVTLDVPRGKILGVVGESGCGKSVTAYSIMRLIQAPGRIVGGQILLHPQGCESFDILSLPETSRQLFDVRGGLAAMIFQEPMTALSPVHTVGNQIMEAILLHQDVSEKEAEAKGIAMLERVGIPGAERRFRQYPFEMSGGMRQRVVIAMAFVCQPELLIADEPTTALDVTIQAQIMNVMKNLQHEFGTSTMLITHDLGVIGQLADTVVVMYMGRIVEEAPVRDLFYCPRHPYTMGLLHSLPSICKEKKLPSIPGSVPSPTETPSGCPFHPRCPHCKKGKCDVGGPPALEELVPGRRVACMRLRDPEMERTSEVFAGMLHADLGSVATSAAMPDTLR